MTTNVMPFNPFSASACNNNNYNNNAVNEAAAMARYHILSVINKGSYGVVYRAWDNNTGKVVAIKHEVHGLTESTLQEINILESLPPHPSIVHFNDATVDTFNNVLVVMEYLPLDLHKLLVAREKTPFTVSEVKTMMRQILRGVDFLHDHGVMHRDLKPENILINSSAELKICDFGLSSTDGCAWGRRSPRVATLWYRAPELLLGADGYSSAIDMWSVGCIMAEIVLREVVFKGKTEFHQLCCIYQTIGFGPFASACSLLRRKVAAAGRSRGAAALSSSGMDLLERLLEFDHKKRITAKDALNHAWFREFYGLHLDLEEETQPQPQH